MVGADDLCRGAHVGDPFEYLLSDLRVFSDLGELFCGQLAWLVQYGLFYTDLTEVMQYRSVLKRFQVLLC